MIPQDTVNTILDTVRVEDIVGDFVTLKRRGASLVACCPFHNEKTPSFYVTPAKGIYKCFGCGKAGSAVTFLMEHEKCSYTEALRYIAGKYKIEIAEEEQSAEEIAQRQRKESLLLVSGFAAKFYRDQLLSGEGKSVGAAYFRQRGISESTIDRFTLGWAPSGRTRLIDAATAAGYKLEYLIAAGLAVQRPDGSVVDKFYERVMFPIHSISGRVVAFSGRTLHADNPAKYVNSAETEIYVKSRNLLGIYFAKNDISRLDKCILVEGNVDMVMMHQLGICNVVASCGTSLTVEQIRMIHRFTENVTIMYDGDSAGIKAALRGLNLVLAEGLNVKVVLLPDGEDPDSFSRKHTREEVGAFIISGERDFISFKTDILLADAGNDPLKKANLINDIADTIANIPDAVKRSVYVETVAQRFGIESAILFDRINKDRTKMADEARMAADRQARLAGRQESAPEGTSESQDAPHAPVQEQDGLSAPAVQGLAVNRLLDPAERTLLEFMLCHGTEPLNFETDSEFYMEGCVSTVADFIRDALEPDGAEMANGAYARVYAEYCRHYDEGLEQEEIVKRLYSCPDPVVSSTAVSIAVEKHKLTVQKFSAALTTRSSWLVSEVPRAIFYYAERRIQDKLDTLRKSLADPSTDQEAAMAQIVRLRTRQQEVKKKLGR